MIRFNDKEITYNVKKDEFTPKARTFKLEIKVDINAMPFSLRGIPEVIVFFVQIG